VTQIRDQFLEIGMIYWNKKIQWKAILLGISVLSFNSCSIDTSRIAPGYVEAIRTIKGVFIGIDNELITPELIKNIPYASSTLSIGRGAPGLIILASQDSDKETWVSADGVYLILEKGRIKKTAGLFNNLVSFKAVKSDFKRLVDSKESETLIYYYSYDEPELINMRVEAKRKFIGVEEVKFLGFEKKLNLIEEKITNDYIGWKEINKFWVDENMFVWRSEQYISPKLPKFIIQVTKKPAK
jgi:hypothetical protein